MSRAFVRESDDRPEPPLARQPSSLPAGAKNYLTPGGAARLRLQLEKLVEQERPRLAAMGDNADAKARILSLDQQVDQLEQSLQSAKIVASPADDTDVVRFGATVTARRSDGAEDQYRIVGVDEIDLDKGWVSWLSPIAKALLNARNGKRVRFKFPSGQEELEILRVEYEDL